MHGYPCKSVDVRSGGPWLSCEIVDRLCQQGPALQRAGNVFAAAKGEFDSKGSNWGQLGVRLGVRLLTGWAGGITLS